MALQWILVIYGMQNKNLGLGGYRSRYSYSLRAEWFEVQTSVGAIAFIFSTPVQNYLGSHSDSSNTDTGNLPRKWRDQGVILTAHPHLAPRLSMGGALPLLPLRTLRGDLYIYFTDVKTLFL